jgi:hypothetical protein
VISQKKMMLFEMYKHMGENRLKAMLRERTASRREAEGGIADILNKWGDKP